MNALLVSGGGWDDLLEPSRSNARQEGDGLDSHPAGSEYSQWPSGSEVDMTRPGRQAAKGRRSMRLPKLIRGFIMVVIVSAIWGPRHSSAQDLKSVFDQCRGS